MRKKGAKTAGKSRRRSQFQHYILPLHNISCFRVAIQASR
ncbi:hypothetical protein HMPREF0201_01672 [Cedecea davisae DSM 4568]|uniref:Uncharacterized protein n=1 Tax=Cedecea davisae DSM 4568 TaxID=566551 RepID=S3JC21_9ENTR|nr:hypothetical protein HMPREF0201_01672 [Cedecea davisae DSM 4568]